MDEEKEQKIPDCECRSAKEYAHERLKQADGIVRSAGLAEDYDCSPDYMSEALSALVDDGEARRVGYGRYVSVDSEAEEREESEEGVGECPVEGCSFYGLSENALRGHANAASDHEWSEIADELDLEVIGEIEASGDSSENEESEDREENEPEEPTAPAIPTDVAVGVVAVIVVLVFLYLYLETSGSTEQQSQPTAREQRETSGGLMR